MDLLIAVADPDIQPEAQNVADQGIRLKEFNIPKSIAKLDEGHCRNCPLPGSATDSQELYMMLRFDVITNV